ncbi:MAG: nucleotidyltransferase domain-containing protein [Thermoguttaceae bacterium]
MNHGLSERSLATIGQIFARYPAVERAVLYGSRAEGNYKPGSDIDLTLHTNDAFTHTDLLRIMGDFDDSTLPYMVDVSEYKTLQNDDLIAHIDRVGKVIYEKKSPL